MEAIKKAYTCVRFAGEKKARETVLIELTGLTDIADFFLITSGTSERHVRTIADGIQTGMKTHGIKPFSMEGYDEGRWVIIDYQSLIVHIFLEPLRDLYDLETLWIEAKRHNIEKENRTGEVEDGERTT